MTEEEKRFKIKKKISYQELMNKEEKLQFKLYATTLFGAMSTVYLLANAQNNPSLIGAITTGTVSMSVTGITSLIKSICKQTMYESKLEDIQMQLEMLDLNSNTTENLDDKDAGGKSR